MDLECPYCGFEQSVCHDDGYGLEEDVAHWMSCGGCDKHFVFRTFVSFSYSPIAADCLNGGSCDYRPTTTFPINLTKMECSVCEDTRSLTSEEREKFKIK